MSDRRLLFVHAHPDDESISSGGTMARYAASGAQVTLVTCTLGEEGEIYLPSYAELAADKGDQLGGYRIGELASACAALGISDHRFLGGAGRFRDSGMMGAPANHHPRAFWGADVDAAGGLLAAIIDETKPQVVVTYDRGGQYGHPDHIQTHRVTEAALQQASHSVSKVYNPSLPRSVVRAGIAAFTDAADHPFGDVASVDDLPFVSPDGEVTTRIDVAAFAPAKQAALAAHASQIPTNSWLFHWALGFSEVAEYFTLVRGVRGPAAVNDAHGRESDLFAGLS